MGIKFSSIFFGGNNFHGSAHTFGNSDLSNGKSCQNVCTGCVLEKETDFMD